MEWHYFQPTRLVRAREVVVQAHPGTAAAPAHLSDDEVPALRQRIAAAKGNSMALDALARALTPREVRALIPGLLQWENLRSATAYLLEVRLRPEHVVALWRAWQRMPRLHELKHLIGKATAQFGWGAAVGLAYAGVAPAWVAAAEPGVAIQSWLDELGLGYSDCLLLAESPFTPDAPLLRLVRDAVMTHGSAAQLRVEGSERLYGWQAELSPTDRVLFGRNYLVKVPASSWYRPILDWIERSYGVPRRPRVPSFWEGVPEAVKKAFQKLFIQKWIGEIFQNDADRSNYWQRWAEHMEYVQRGVVGRTEYGVMDFGSFGVVEFFEVGNAAYFYPEQMLQRIRARAVTAVSDLKERHYPRFGWGSDNRLIHNPSPRGWYSRGDSMVTAWIAGTR